MTAAFDPANEAERLLLEAAEHPGAMPAFLRAFGAGQAWVPGTGAGDATTRTLPAGATLALPLWESEDGRRYVPVFTSEERLAASAPEGTPFLRLATQALLDVLDPEAWMGINPGAPLGLLLPANAVRGATGAAQVREGMPYAIGEPAEEPVALLDDLCTWFAEDQPVVARAWRAVVVMDPQGGGRPEPLIGLELEPGVEPEPVFEAAVRRLERHGHGSVLLVPVDPSAPEGPAAWLLEHTQPFYTRDVAQ